MCFVFVALYTEICSAVIFHCIELLYVIINPEYKHTVNDRCGMFYDIFLMIRFEVSGMYITRFYIVMYYGIINMYYLMWQNLNILGKVIAEYGYILFLGWPNCLL